MPRTIPINLYVGDRIQTLVNLSETTIVAGTVGIVVSQIVSSSGGLETVVRFDGQRFDTVFPGTTTSKEFRKLPKSVSIVSPSPADQPFPSATALVDDGFRDEIYEAVVDFVLQQRKIDTTMIRRQFDIDVSRAAKLTCQLECDEIVSPMCGQNTSERIVLGVGKYRP